MGLFDVFSFKKEAQKVFNRENFNIVLTTAREAIVSFVDKEILGSEKKKRVDEIVVVKIIELTANVKNGLVLWVIDKLIDLVPVVTQLVYDFLKEKVENL